MIKAWWPAALAGFACCLLVGAAQPAEAGKADIVLRNGKIYTADAARSIKQALAFTGNTIVAVGTDADMDRLVGPQTKIVDLAGKLVLPGLFDTHIHPIIGAVDQSKCSLANVKATIETLTPVVRACLAKAPGGPDDWFEAVQLDNYGFAATAKDLDKIEKDRPIALGGNDGHTVWVNSRGLELLGVTAQTPDPPGGKIARDGSGAPSGSFTDSAASIVSDKMPMPSLEERATLTASALKDMAAYGITSVLDAYVTPADATVWRMLYDSGRLSMRVRMAVYVADPTSLLKPAANANGGVAGLVATAKDGDVDPDFLRSSLVKIFADGVMEYPAQTAAMLAPYLDAEGKPTDHVGELYFDPGDFAKLVTKLDAAGVTVHVHAIGDRGVRATLDAFAAARAANGDKGNRHQIAHLQLVDPADFPRFKQLGVIADMQLEWARREPATEGPLEAYLGPARYRYVYPAGSLHRAGATIAGGSDWDVSTFNPFRAMEVAVTRASGKGQAPLNSDEAIPLTTAVDAYTINAAYAMGQDATTGSLEVGKRADLAVLDRDILSIDPFAIGDTKVVSTYLDGQLVHSGASAGTDDDEDEDPGRWWDEREARMRAWLHRD
jgi:predicted amidohydrolase YtcJ